MRWNKAYDGTKESLHNKSHKPHSSHPRAHTEQEQKRIRDYHRRKKSKHTGKYETPTSLGEKWQMDVKYAPNVCYSGKDRRKFYQYTVIEETTRKRFIYAYEEQSSYSTIDFFKRATTFFGYAPNILQTDNGAEFSHLSKTKRVHPLDVFCNKYRIQHKLIRPRTPWHNGKEKRSHRNDQERFYNHLNFYSLYGLQEQMKRYLSCSNNIPMAVLGWKSPGQKQCADDAPPGGVREVTERSGGTNEGSPQGKT